jgi:hypothetical protein
MPTAAIGQRTALRLVSESSFGVPSGTVYKAIRQITNTLNLKKNTLQSKEIRPDRLLSDLRHGMRTVAGDIQAELQLSAHDDLIAGAVSDNWAAVTTGAQSLAAAAAGNTITRTAGSFLADGIFPGDEVDLSGFTVPGNNGHTKVKTVSANGLTLTVEKVLTDDAAAAGRTIALTGKRVKSGTVQETFSIERAFTDISQFLLFSGCAVDQLKLTVKPEALIDAAFTIIGKDMVQAAVSAATSVTPAPTNSPFDAFTGVLEEGGAALGIVTSLDLTIANGRKGTSAIGQKTALFLSDGQFGVTGSASIYFEDAVALNKFLNETESAIDVKLLDPNGTDFHRFRVPRVKYTGGELDNPADGPVMLSLPFTGLADPVSGASFIYQRSNP